MRIRNIKTVITLAALLIGGGAWFQSHTASTQSAAAPPAADAGPEAAAAVESMIAQLTVVDQLPELPGYQRGCKKNQKCVFGPAWADVRRTGCDTRNTLLAKTLKDPVFKPGTRRCKVISGVLDPDPYSGRTINFTTDHPSVIQLDHTFALERAWNAGAANWDLQQRKLFANDLDNLLVVDGRLNESKSSSGLEWLPPNTEFRCTYVQRYLSVAVKYRFPITRNDQKIATATCHG